MSSPRGVGDTTPPFRLPEQPAPHEHLVGFYESETFLVSSVARFVTPALRAGDAAVLVATPEHREAVCATLDADGVDVAAASEHGQLLSVDAEELLGRFMVDGAPEPRRFERAVGALLDRAAAGDRNVRVHGEMVALLWERGEVAAALALEDLWNELISARPFTLFCAYPMRAFAREGSTEGFQTVCGQHAAVLPTETYSELPDEEARHRMVALLQQEATVGVNSRITLRHQYHELEEELRRTRELGRLRDELIATLMDGIGGPTAEAATRRRRSAGTFEKTATRAVRRYLQAASCTFTTDAPGPVRGEATTPPGYRDVITVPMSTDGGTRGVLHVELGQARTVTTPELTFVRSVARLLASAHDHELASRRRDP